MIARWHNLSASEAAAELSTDLERGLTDAEARERLDRYGPNMLPEVAAVSPWQILLDQFKSVMTLLLVAAAGIALLVGEELDAIAIVIVLLLNALLGFFNEYRAERSVQGLKALVTPSARVIRDGKTEELPAAELAPGDLITFEAGDRIPADARLVAAWNLRVDEAALTGESVAVDKDATASIGDDASLADRLTMVYTGTSAVQGRATAIVTATGAETEVGRISTLMSSAGREKTPLEERLDRLGKYLAVAAVGIAALMVLVGLWRGQELLPLLETSLALAIAAVPEGLPAVLTIALALGMRRMAQRKAIVRRLSAVETLGSTNVICTDKTGTLTQNEMTVREVFWGEQTVTVGGAGYEPVGEFLTSGKPLSPAAGDALLLTLRAGLLCNSASLAQDDEGRWGVVGDPTEGALLVLAAKGGLNREAERDHYATVAEVPFDSRERRMATVHAGVRAPGPKSLPTDPHFTYFVKGAPESVLPACTKEQLGHEPVEVTAPARERVLRANADMAGRALRVLALAYKEAPCEDEDPFEDLVFLGLVGMIDPPREEAKESVRRCQEAGIRVAMITGDQKETARAIAGELGIVAGDGTARVVDGATLDATDDAALRELVGEVGAYARVSPEHKLRIVRALQDRGQVVAMTGDGVNDAPALKAADIGVAMGRAGTDVAREAADMVLANDNFSTIVAAVEEGRVVFANVRKFVHYLFSCNLSEIITMFVAALLGWPMPLQALQILWLNLVTDVFPALALASEPAEDGIMQRRPPETRRARPPASFLGSVTVQGLLLAASTLAAFSWALSSTGDLQRASTVAFLTLGLAQLFHVFNSRFESGSAFGRRFFSNRAVWGAILLTIGLQVAAVYLPGLQRILRTTAPAPGEWVVVGLAALAPAVIIELYKALWHRRDRTRVAG